MEKKKKSWNRTESWGSSWKHIELHPRKITLKKQIPLNERCNFLSTAHLLAEVKFQLFSEAGLAHHCFERRRNNVVGQGRRRRRQRWSRGTHGIGQRSADAKKLQPALALQLGVRQPHHIRFQVSCLWFSIKLNRFHNKKNIDPQPVSHRTVRLTTRKSSAIWSRT